MGININDLEAILNHYKDAKFDKNFIDGIVKKIENYLTEESERLLRFLNSEDYKKMTNQK